MKEGLEKDTKKLDSVVKDGDTNSEIGKKKSKEERPPTKVVVRRLPPTMTEEEFLQQIEPIPPVDYMYYVPADLSLSPNAFCRAYLNFINQSDIFIFTQKFDGYVFVDSKGLEYPAVVEFAPFQRIPKLRPGRKKDSKAGTLETDPTYISFLEKLNAQIQENTTTGSNMKQHFFETNVALSMTEDNKVNSTPLLDYLRARHAERVKAREEKRKKDLERKRARDEQRRSAKKSEEEPTVVKVLPTQNNSSSSGNTTSTTTTTFTTNVSTPTTTKDKFKEKDAIKPIKKRSDERIKETKGRIGKSYAEERQRQLERREEQKKRFASSSLNSKPSKPTKLLSDQKPGEQNSVESDKGQDSESKKTVSEPKVSDDTIKNSSYEKKSYQHKYSQESQKHYDRNKRDDGIKRRSKDNDRLSKTRDQYHHDRRDDRYNNKKKIISDFKKGYNRYDDYTKDKNKKDMDNKPDKKVDAETKNEKVVSDTGSHAIEIKRNVVEKNLKLSDVESAIKGNDSTEDCSGKYTENNEVSNCLEKNEVQGIKKVEASSEVSINSEETSLNYEPLKNAETEPNEKICMSIEGKTESENNSENDCNTQLVSLDSSSVPVENSSEIDSEKHGNPEVDKNCEENENVKLMLSEKEDSGPPSEQCNASENSSEWERNNENDFNLNTGNQDSEGLILKRRNSLEMYERKVESSEKNNRRENGRRSSLESGDQRKNCLQLQLEINEKKKCDGDHLESKPKDPRTERRIRNKDRPTMEIYRPGMGRFSKQRMEREKVLGSSTEVDSNSTSPSPTLIPKNKFLTNNN